MAWYNPMDWPVIGQAAAIAAAPLTIAGTAFAGGKQIYDIYSNERNYSNQQELIEYQKNLQQTIFDREDNAVARRVADLKASGLSPTLAAGSSAGAGSPIQVSSAKREFVPSNPLQDLSTASQINIGQRLADNQIDKTNADKELIKAQMQNLSYGNTKSIADAMKSAQEFENLITKKAIDDHNLKLARGKGKLGETPVGTDVQGQMISAGAKGLSSIFNKIFGKGGKK